MLSNEAVREEEARKASKQGSFNSCFSLS
jgi:hypothetical protein